MAEQRQEEKETHDKARQKLTDYYSQFDQNDTDNKDNDNFVVNKNNNSKKNKKVESFQSGEFGDTPVGQGQLKRDTRLYKAVKAFEKDLDGSGIIFERKRNVFYMPVGFLGTKNAVQVLANFLPRSTRSKLNYSKPNRGRGGAVQAFDFYIPDVESGIAEVRIFEDEKRGLHRTIKAVVTVKNEDNMNLEESRTKTTAKVLANLVKK